MFKNIILLSTIVTKHRAYHCSRTCIYFPNAYILYFVAITV